MYSQASSHDAKTLEIGWNYLWRGKNCNSRQASLPIGFEALYMRSGDKEEIRIASWLHRAWSGLMEYVGAFSSMFSYKLIVRGAGLSYARSFENKRWWRPWSFSIDRIGFQDHRTESFCWAILFSSFWAWPIADPLWRLTNMTRRIGPVEETRYKL